MSLELVLGESAVNGKLVRSSMPSEGSWYVNLTELITAAPAQTQKAQEIRLRGERKFALDVSERGTIGSSGSRGTEL